MCGEGVFIMLESYINSVVQYLVIVPAAIFCYLPMKNQLKYNIKKLILAIILVLSLVIPLSAMFCVLTGCTTNSLLLPLMLLFFLLYQMTLNVHISQCIFMFSFSALLMSFICNLSTGFDAILYPYSGTDFFSTEAALFQLGISFLAVIILAVPLRHFGSRLFDTLNFSYIWYIFSFITIMYLMFNMIIIPHNYQTLYTNNTFNVFWAVNIFLFLMMLFICVVFYLIADGILKGSKNAERVRFLEMQEKQYLAQCKYMEETSKLRHDFRYTIHTLQVLLEEKNYEAVDKYIKEYIETFPVNEIVHYCNNIAVNAVLNFYAQDAKLKNIRLKWSINLPDDISISDIDLCSILGNILENAIDGCMLLPEGKRYHLMSITQKHYMYLYIVSVNSFNGKVKRKGEHYQSFGKNGSGIGLSSVSLVAEANGGSAQFSNSDKEFYADVMMKL